MNILSIYFSGTNNTKHINDLIKSKLNLENINFKEINVNNTKNDYSNIVFNNYDLYIIGAPVYVEVFNSYFVNFIKKNLQYGQNRKVILYQTSANGGPSALYGLNEYLLKCGYNVCALVSFKMINNFYMSGTFKYTEEDVRPELLEVVHEKTDKIIEVINNESDAYFDIIPSKKRYYIGKTVYKMLEKSYLQKYAKKHFSGSNDCTACGVCKNNCVTNNIEVSKSTKTIKFGKNCTACMRCIHICENQAILFDDKKIRKLNMLKM